VIIFGPFGECEVLIYHPKDLTKTNVHKNVKLWGKKWNICIVSNLHTVKVVIRKNRTMMVHLPYILVDYMLEAKGEKQRGGWASGWEILSVTICGDVLRIVVGLGKPLKVVGL